MTIATETEDEEKGGEGRKGEGVEGGEVKVGDMRREGKEGKEGKVRKEGKETKGGTEEKEMGTQPTTKTTTAATATALHHRKTIREAKKAAGEAAAKAKGDPANKALADAADVLKNRLNTVEKAAASDKAAGDAAAAARTAHKDKEAGEKDMEVLTAVAVRQVMETVVHAGAGVKGAVWGDTLTFDVTAESIKKGRMIVEVRSLSLSLSLPLSFPLSPSLSLFRRI